MMLSSGPSEILKLAKYEENSLELGSFFMGAQDYMNPEESSTVRQGSKDPLASGMNSKSKGTMEDDYLNHRRLGTQCKTKKLARDFKTGVIAFLRSVQAVQEPYPRGWLN